MTRKKAELLANILDLNYTQKAEEVAVIRERARLAWPATIPVTANAPDAYQNFNVGNDIIMTIIHLVDR